MHTEQGGGGREQSAADQCLDRRHMTDDNDCLALVLGEQPVQCAVHARATAAKVSPPGGAASAPASQAAISSGHCCETSAKLRPSQLPKSVSARSSSTVMAAPTRSGHDFGGLPGADQRRGPTRSMPPRPASRRQPRQPAAAELSQRDVAPAGETPFRGQGRLAVPEQDRRRRLAVTAAPARRGCSASVAAQLAGSEPGFIGPDQDSPAFLAPHHVIGGSRPNRVQVDRVERQVASLAAAHGARRPRRRRRAARAAAHRGRSVPPAPRLTTESGGRPPCQSVPRAPPAPRPGAP